MRVDAYTEPFDLGQYKRNSSLIVHYHSVRFQGFKARHSLCLSSRAMDPSTGPNGFNSVRQSQLCFHIQFVYFGDAQNDILDHWSRVIRWHIKQPRMLHLRFMQVILSIMLIVIMNGPSGLRQVVLYIASGPPFQLWEIMSSLQ